jgi:hypothetical protein
LSSKIGSGVATLVVELLEELELVDVFLIDSVGAVGAVGADGVLIGFVAAGVAVDSDEGALVEVVDGVVALALVEVSLEVSPG